MSCNNGALATWLRCLPVLLIVSFSGCYERDVAGDVATYHFAWYVGPLVIFGGLLAALVGWVVQQWSRKWGWALMILSPLVLIIIAPAIFQDEVVVDDQGFTTTYGFWFAPTIQRVAYEDVRFIEAVRVRKRRSVSNELHCIMKNGATVILPNGDLLKFAFQEIIDRAKVRGVPISAVGQL